MFPGGGPGNRTEPEPAYLGTEPNRSLAEQNDIFAKAAGYFTIFYDMFTIFCQNLNWAEISHQFQCEACTIDSDQVL